MESVTLAPAYLKAVEGEAIPTFNVSGTVGEDFRGSDLARAVMSFDEGNGVKLILNTRGGDANEAFHFYDFIRANAIKVFVDGYGQVMSAGTIIMAAAGRKRSRLAPNAEYMVHNSSGGDAERRKNADLKLSNIYAELTGKDRKVVSAMMDKETFMSAEEARKNGFVGEVIQLQKLAANADKPMSETTKVKREFPVGRDEALTALVTGKISIEADVDSDLKAQLDSAVTDLKAEQAKVADLEASLKTKPEDIAAAVKVAEDALKAKHEADLKTVGAEADKLKAEIDVLKKTPLEKPVKAEGDTVVETEKTDTTDTKFEKITDAERQAGFDNMRNAQASNK